MPRTFVMLIVLALAAQSQAQEIVHISDSNSLGGDDRTLLGTITNGALSGNNVLTIDEIISRPELSGGDSWFAVGFNSAGGANSNVPTASDVGWLTRTRTDASTNHQLFDAPGATKASSGATQTGISRTNATVSLGVNGIATGNFADVVVRYDDDNNGTVDHILGGSFDWSANSADLHIATQDKTHDYTVTASSAPTQFTLFDTGVDDNGAVLAPGSTDTHWQITSTPNDGPFGNATVQQNHPAWLANDPVGTVGGTSWISTVANGPTTIDAGPYTFEQTFSLDGFDPDTAVVVMEIAVDNVVNDVLLNGNSLGISHSGFADFSGVFEVDTGFIGGDNTFTFLMENLPPDGPGGLRVNFLQSTAQVAVPEPASIAIWSLIGLGIAGFGYTRIRRKK